jgi:hypothetical protein
MAERTLTAPTDGPIELGMRLNGGRVSVSASDQVERAKITVTGTEAEVASVDQDPGQSQGTWSVSSTATGARTATSASAGSDNHVTAHGQGSVAVDYVKSLDLSYGPGGMTMNGMTPAQFAESVGADSTAGEQRFHIDVVLPEGSALSVQSRTADVEVSGPLGKTEVTTESGDIKITGAGNSVTTRTAVGRTEVHAAKAAKIDAYAVSGRIEVTAGDGVAVQVKATSVSGRVIKPQGTAAATPRTPGKGASRDGASQAPPSSSFTARMRARFGRGPGRSR